VRFLIFTTFYYGIEKTSISSSKYLVLVILVGDIDRPGEEKWDNREAGVVRTCMHRIGMCELEGRMTLITSSTLFVGIIVYCPVARCPTSMLDSTYVCLL
jgi:hypothetical protein